TAGAESRVTRRWRIDDLKKEIEDIHRTTPAPDDVTSERGRLLAKRRALAASVQDALRQLPEAVAEYSRLASELAAVRRDVAGRRRTASGSGAQNNADDMQARAARLVAQRMAALTGEAPEEEEQDDEEEKEIARELAQRNDRAETVSSSVRRVQQAVRGLPGATMPMPWADEQAASEEVRELLGRLRRIERQPSKQRASAFSPVADAPAKDESRGAAVKEVAGSAAGDAPSLADRLARAQTKQERDQILRDLAEERFRERQRALGLPDTDADADANTKANAPPQEMSEKPVASNPFAASAAAATANAPAPADADSSDEEWDRDESSDDSSDSDDEPARAASPRSAISFNTAFAPAADSNPFLGLLAAATSPTPLPPFEHVRVRALYPYQPDGAVGELAIQPGELIETRPVDHNTPGRDAHAADGWMFGEVLQEADDSEDGWGASGRTGWFPREYAETLGAPGSRAWIKTRAKFGRAKYAYTPQHDDELRVAQGDRVRVVDGDAAESWWRVRVIASSADSADKLEGMLPAIYIELDK
ncbi:hypothetical protein LPJ73_001683, partial [Coemansia sp. RSA 2703]